MERDIPKRKICSLLSSNQILVTSIFFLPALCLWEVGKNYLNFPPIFFIQLWPWKDTGYLINAIVNCLSNWIITQVFFFDKFQKKMSRVVCTYYLLNLM